MRAAVRAKDDRLIEELRLLNMLQHVGAVRLAKPQVDDEP